MPSPSALVVLLGAVGRTVFGGLLVVGYGFDMAATLTAAGLLLVRMRGLLDRIPVTRRAIGLTRFTPLLTAGLVVVGLGLLLRGLTGSV